MMSKKIGPGKKQQQQPKKNDERNENLCFAINGIKYL